ncbi:hypothetical protein BTUL_0234g00130 [Botrytis tulipae]|uniref:Uncharacterized protein n=1 Tax=Botrytis tulipae TaxID=87230 RepID=A0A4Z1E7E9_9HELO|nr:hypothetical protein BTUL_0234g00130 [Botrytis tulipae]
MGWLAGSGAFCIVSYRLVFAPAVVRFLPQDKKKANGNKMKEIFNPHGHQHNAIQHPFSNFCHYAGT